MGLVGIIDIAVLALGFSSILFIDNGGEAVELL
jgi:hypothetical protein